ncbi:hypothetical protein [Nonomuraea basaltis]|uniref:hypothetical protein n=1 Tax=Nonomuraea basaltis TaxID=2495887 RepID=UPI00110C68DE|nr:hypothetical protein [Nonomuraea basaltis]TMR91323.1 hypothetical protein EJK15_50550 [Nonomuraea basaltis]
MTWARFGDVIFPLSTVTNIAIKPTTGSQWYVEVSRYEGNYLSTIQTPAFATKPEAERTAERIAHGLYWEGS